VLEDELNDLEGKLQRAEKLVTGEQMHANQLLYHSLSMSYAHCLHVFVHYYPMI
jgi:hypothetical protein